MNSQTRKFENIQLNDEVSFEENGNIETGIVVEVNKNTFKLSALRHWDNNGIKSFYDQKFSFLKTGTKSHSHYTHGNAIKLIFRPI
jgi:hypothetical protein